MSEEVKKNPLEVMKDYRRRIVAGEDLSDEELREGIAALHQFRTQQAGVSKEKVVKEKAAKPSPSTAKITNKSATNLLEDLL